MILTPSQRRAMERGVATSNAVLPVLDMLRELAEHDPAIKQRHDDLRTQRDFLFNLSSKALQLDRMS